MKDIIKAVGSYKGNGLVLIVMFGVLGLNLLMYSQSGYAMTVVPDILSSTMLLPVCVYLATMLMNEVIKHIEK